MKIVDNILEIAPNNELAYHIRIEALWILAALSITDDEEDFRLLFLSCYADNKLIKDTEAAKYDFENEKSSIF